MDFYGMISARSVQLPESVRARRIAGRLVSARVWVMM